MALNILVLLVVLKLVSSHNDSQVKSTFKKENDDKEHKEYTVKLPFEMSNPSLVSEGELYQADILLSDEQRAALKGTRKALPNKEYRWTEGPDGYPLIPYVFQDSVNQTDVRAGLDHWMEHTCIKFEETNITDRPHLQFHIGTGCWSKLGMNYWKNGQQISIGQNCNDRDTVVHEIGHALGFYHEQSRSDRDDYVSILFNNIEDDREDQFEKYDDNNYGIPYDYASNMHYGHLFFSKNNNPTIVTTDPLALALIAYENGLTHRDILLALRMYNCTGKWLAKCSISSDPCQNDGYIGKDCTCICPPGTNGTNCEEIVSDYYAKLHHPQTEKIYSEKSIKAETPLEAGSPYIVKWIVPPTCKKAKVTFTSSNMYSGGCQFQNLYVRTTTSITDGQVMCSTDVKAGAVLTSDTGIIIMLYNRVSYSFKRTLWEADVTFENITGCPATETVACEKWPTRKVTSPNFPSIHPEGNIGCGWNLKVPENSSLTVTCDKFESNGTISGVQNVPSLTLRKISFTLDVKSGSERE